MASFRRIARILSLAAVAMPTVLAAVLDSTDSSSTTPTTTRPAPIDTPSLRPRQTVWIRQCGGIGYTLSTECPDGYYCAYINPWYSQCTSNPTTTAPSTATQTALGQCGGTDPDWTGPTACPDGYVCTYQSPYTSDCLPSDAGGD
ncbi:carbohydrate-binding module family 1 protein [Auriscalpium vulgare]|uniref:Carbohydrate-binding module family 1 protein n=1 Tax=Auriscalpium vulgare TaxID=40419 RepID=A0ACB8RJJ0_9AGAM|nr:carbohydrate-binding module family 1 protein [Auriscalpium vulgare]